jgi:hypothetical protein
MTDLFRTAKEQLADWIKDRHIVKTSDVIKWGTQNHSNRAERNARELCAEGKIRRLDNTDRIFYFPKIKEDVWEWVESADKTTESCIESLINNAESHGLSGGLD